MEQSVCGSSNECRCGNKFQVFVLSKGVASDQKWLRLKLSGFLGGRLKFLTLYSFFFVVFFFNRKWKQIFVV